MVKAQLYNKLSIEGWTHILQSKIESYNAQKYVVVGTIFTIIAILSSITVAFFTRVLFIYTVVVMGLFVIGGVLSLLYFEKKKKELSTLLDEILEGKYKQGNDIHKKWLTLTMPKKK